MNQYNMTFMDWLRYFERPTLSEQACRIYYKYHGYIENATPSEKKILNQCGYQVELPKTITIVVNHFPL